MVDVTQTCADRAHCKNFVTLSNARFQEYKQRGAAEVPGGSSGCLSGKMTAWAWTCQQLVGTVTPAFDQPCTSALPLQTVCCLLGVWASAYPTGPRQLCL